MIKNLPWMFFILLTTICFTGCGDDNEHEDDTVDTDYITGKWQGVSSSGYDMENGKIIDSWEDNEAYDFKTIEFRNDASGECTDPEVYVTFQLTWQINSRNQLHLDMKYGNTTIGVNYKIKTLTSNKLILVSEEGDENYGSHQEDTYRRIK